MKSLLLILVACCLGACADSNNGSRTKVASKSIVPLTESEMLVLEQVKDQLNYNMMSSQFLRASYTVIQSVKDLDNFHIFTVPFYDFNETSFFENPIPERIQECFILSDSCMCFAGSKDDEIEFMIQAKFDGLHWSIGKYIEASDSFKKVFSCMFQKGQDVHVVGHRLFYVYGSEFFVYMKDNKPVYNTFAGQSFSEEQFCEHLHWMKNMKDQRSQF